MTASRQAILQFIDENLEWGDVKEIAYTLHVRQDTVCRVRKGLRYSTRILKALEDKAMLNKTHAIKITEYLNKDLTK
jgi:hypothetical protein